MAYIGQWGQFIHIPKCGGLSMRTYLNERYNIGREQNAMHGMPDKIDNAWTIIRDPRDWLPSFYAYYSASFWHWPDLPPYIAGLFDHAAGRWWPEFVQLVTALSPGIVGKVYDYYCANGVRVYKLEEIKNHFPGLQKIHPTDWKPLVTDEQREWIAVSEADTVIKYGYNNTR